MTASTRRTAAVIGGGPAGLMAAEVLAEGGLKVTVIEHMASVGRKFLLAGRSGLNLTHSEPLNSFIERYATSWGAAPGHVDHRLRAALTEFGPEDLRAWAAGLGQPTFIGTSGRVFPESWRATPLLRAWLARLETLGVTVLTRHAWVGFGSGHTEIRIRPRSGSPDAGERGDPAEIPLHPDVVILALGGGSWPRVGSDGAWVGQMRAAGIAVAELTSANAGVRMDWSPEFRARWAGHPLKNLELRIDSTQIRGDLMITDHGLEGGPIYALNPAIRAQLATSTTAAFTVDLHPDLDSERIAERWQRRRTGDSVSTALRRTLGFDPAKVAWLREVAGGPLPRAAADLAALVKGVKVEVGSLAPLDRAISSAGGVDLEELDDSFMFTARPGVYAVGEMLDWEAPTGGYLLQASFSTAVLAARTALNRLSAAPQDAETVPGAEFVEIADGDRLWRFETDFLRSRWSCIWGRGCKGIETEPDPESGLGCCSWGAQMDSEDEAMNLSAMAAMIPEGLMQYADPARAEGIFSDATRTNTRVVDGACIFLNRPGFRSPDGTEAAGCALHLAALAAGEAPLDWKPSVCWQVPIKVDWEVVDHRPGIAEVATMRRWQRKDWGEEGATMAWCCTEGPEAYIGDQPVIDSLSAEIAEIVGETVWVQLRAHPRLCGD